MLRRKLRTPNELSVTDAQRRLENVNSSGSGIGTVMIEVWKFRIGERVWMFKPTRGAKASKFVHSWIEPLRIKDEARYENFLLEREDVEEHNR
ncbi:hypothetical protein PHMEG_0006574 [Phytophthora megakarya]|uniref:Uncharacterized protein n=1 Tax=Phytophthora megakarya TaxID=4795 RepID=A0A225WPF9_9STRA|nr:hypothetical protein PHMEG_0006574 [Phytophthora megakarya]